MDFFVQTEVLLSPGSLASSHSCLLSKFPIPWDVQELALKS